MTTVHSSRESAPAGRRHRRGPRVRGEQGFALIEALVAATLLVIMALGFLAALDAAARSSADNKGRAQAASLAQQDMERMRALNVTDLTGTNATRTQVVGNVTYTIASKAVWIDDSTGNATCSGGASNADYLKVSSTVTWPTMGKIKPVTSTTIVAVPNGSFGSGQGSIQALVEDHTPTGIPGLPVNLSGPSTGTLSTDGAGCVFWGYLPVGTYTVALNQAGYVDWKGQQSVSQTQDVVGGSTSNFVFDYDRAANLDVSFDTQVGASTQVASAKSIMLGNASLAKEKVEPGSEPAELLESVIEAIERAAALAGKMQAYSGGGRAIVGPIALNDAVSAEIDELRFDISTDVEITCELAGDPPAVCADRGQIRQLLRNLIENAVEAIGAKAGTVTVSTGVVDADTSYLAKTYLGDELEPMRYAYIEVDDDGEGIDKEIMARIFEPFFSTRFQGRGLGLAAALGIIRAHKGAFVIDSKIHRGTTVRALRPAPESTPGQGPCAKS